MPPICKADHDLVHIEQDIKAKRIKQASHKINLYNRANKTALHDHMSQFKESYLSEVHSHMSVNDMWVKFKTGFLEAVERFILIKNDQNKVQSAIDRCYNQTAYEKTPETLPSCLKVKLS